MEKKNKNKRTVIKLTFNKDREKLEIAVMKILALDGFKPFNYKGESCYKKGDGFASYPEYIKTEYTGNEIIITAWVYFWGKERELDKKFIACVPKQDCLTTVNKLIALVNA